MNFSKLYEKNMRSEFTTTPVVPSDAPVMVLCLTNARRQWKSGTYGLVITMPTACVPGCCRLRAVTACLPGNLRVRASAVHIRADLLLYTYIKAFWRMLFMKMTSSVRAEAQTATHMYKVGKLCCQTHPLLLQPKPVAPLLKLPSSFPQTGLANWGAPAEEAFTFVHTQ
jgi:hypothetical protein